MRVSTAGQFTKSYPVCEGVLPGESLSPFLFSLFIADLETYYRDKGLEGLSIGSNHDILMLLYADDLVILSHSPADLSRKLNVLEEYTELNKLTVNMNKTKIVAFSKANYESKAGFAFKNN